MTTYLFPPDFWWGTAVSATQIEGAADRDGKGKNIWDHWYEIEPNRFFNEVGPAKTSQFYDRYKDDIALMKKLGHTSFRFSISWSRLIPAGNGAVNKKAVQFYDQVIDELLAAGITPFVNLFHFDMPMAMQKIGGFENREVAYAFARYAEICFTHFGDRVKTWFTHNEPIVPVEGGYLYEFHYPKVVDFKRAVQVGYHTMLSSALAIERYRRLGQGGKIGIILNLTPSYPRAEENERDVEAAKLADAFFNRSFLDPSVKGTFPQELVAILKQYGLMPHVEEGDKAVISGNTVDLLGVNYYQPRRVKAKETPIGDGPLMPGTFFDSYDMPGKKINPHRGWEIYEKGIYDLLMNIKDHYGNIECFISENGMGVEGEEKFRDEAGVIQDDYRIEFISNHLRWLHKALTEGANVKGYHLWTFMDNWSWTNAYKNRYGFVSVDLGKDGNRTVKKSGWWFKTVIENNGF